MPRLREKPIHHAPFKGGNPSTLQPITRGDTSLGGWKANDLLFGLDDERVLCRRQEGCLDVFLGAGSKIAAATQVELALNIFAMALNRFNTETERMSDLSIAQP